MMPKHATNGERAREPNQGSRIINGPLRSGRFPLKANRAKLAIASAGRILPDKASARTVRDEDDDIVAIGPCAQGAAFPTIPAIDAIAGFGRAADEANPFNLGGPALGRVGRSGQGSRAARANGRQGLSG